MKTARIFIALLALTVCVSACIVRRGYSSGKYRREHVPQPPPGYRGM